MHLNPQQARALLPCVDPGRVLSGRAVGLRDGALLALIAAGLSTAEIVSLRASAVTMTGGHVMVTVARHDISWFAVLPTDLGARLLAWLTESRLWAVPEPLFRGRRGPLTQIGIRQVLRRYRNQRPAPPRRRCA